MCVCAFHWFAEICTAVVYLEVKKKKNLSEGCLPDTFPSSLDGSSEVLLLGWVTPWNVHELQESGVQANLWCDKGPC